jgi:hypothetical protein
MPEFEIGGSHIERVQIPGIDRAFIMRNSSLEAVLFNRNLIGLEFTQACESASRAFLSHLKPELTSIIEDVAELMILSKGMYFWIHNAFAQVFERNLEINFAATRRVEVSSNSAQVEIPYFNFDAPAENLIIGDVLASGATMCTALSHYLDYCQLKRVFVFSIAGSVIGGQTLANFCRSRGVELTLIYGLAAFGLSLNGFDLPFLHPDTITCDEYRYRAASVYEGKPISAVGWDFGTQAQAIRKYKMLCWIEAKYWGLEDSDVFLLKEFPGESRLVEKEKAAYSSAVPGPDSQS